MDEVKRRISIVEPGKEPDKFCERNVEIAGFQRLDSGKINASEVGQSLGGHPS